MVIMTELSSKRLIRHFDETLPGKIRRIGVDYAVRNRFGDGAFDVGELRNGRGSLRDKTGGDGPREALVFRNRQ